MASQSSIAAARLTLHSNPILVPDTRFKMSHNPAPTGDAKEQRWFPLESNPELMNEYIEKLGFDTSLYQFVDVFATEEWALSMIPQPVAAVVFLYPLTEAQRKHATTNSTDDDKIVNQHPLWFIRQRIGNACGTIGLLHALLNANPPAHLRPDSWLEQFQAACPRDMDPDQKAQMLETDARIATLHDQATSSARSATSRGNLEDRIENHFVALVCADGGGGGSTPSTLNDPSPTNNSLLYELDGRRAGPLLHGSTCPETLLPDACRVIRKYMDRDPTEIRFTILALAPRVEPWT